MDFCNKLLSSLQFNALGVNVNLSNIDNEYLKRIGPKVAGTLVFTYFSSHFAWKMWKYYNTRTKIYNKHAECQAALKKLADHLVDQELTLEKRDWIINLKFTELQQKLQTGELKALEVLHAYQSKALQVNEQLNCVIEPIWEAEEQALGLDLNINNKKKGPLHGIPVSLKETILVGGYEACGGYSYFLGKDVKEEDGSIVLALKKLGAVPFMRTNIPQTLVILESSNPIYGVTSNPYNQSKTCGGSSGGEGALIGGLGSPLGIGTDIGGSIRTPAALCGICGLKPTSNRLNTKDKFSPYRGQKSILTCLGPMARDVDSLLITMKALLAPEMSTILTDRTVTFVPFKEEVYEDTKPLVIGYYTYDGNVKCHPTCERAVFEAKLALEKKGHKLVEVCPPDVARLFDEIYIGILFGDAQETLLKLLSDDMIDPCIRSVFTVGYYCPRVLKSFLIALLSLKEPSFASRLKRMNRGCRSVREYWDVIGQLLNYKDKFLNFWKSNQLDAMVCPEIPVPAYDFFTFQRMTGITSYAALYNVVDYPSGTVPITQVTAEDEASFLKSYPRNTILQNVIRTACKDGVGLPVGVQCVALPFQEEVALRVMKDIETHL